MVQESFRSNFIRDEKLRGLITTLEQYDRDIATVHELGNSVDNSDQLMKNHIATSHEAAIREDILRMALIDGSYDSEEDYWRAVDKLDSSGDQRNT